MTVMRFTLRSSLVALLLAVLPVPAPAVTTDHFTLRSGADLVELCATPTNDPLYSAAIHFCHGFGVGVYQTILALTTHEKLEPVLCPPNPAPSRNEGVQRFLAWAKAHPEHLSGPAADVLGRYLVEQYPCPKARK